MSTRQHKVDTQLGRAAVQIFAANDRMNQILIEHLDPAAWRAKPPGKARTIARDLFATITLVIGGFVNAELERQAGAPAPSRSMY